MELLVITIAVLIVAYAVFVVVFPKIVPDDNSERTQKALQRVFEETRQSDEGANVNIASSLDDEPALLQGFYSIPVIKELYPLILKAGMRESAANFMYAFILIFLFALAGLPLLGLGIEAVIMAPVLSYALIYLFLSRKVRKRNDMFINAFPDVLDMFVRSLKSGFPVTTAFRSIAENMDPPVSTEFERVVHEQAMGQSVHAALSRLAERIDESDIHFFVVVMKVQQETGGNLAEVIANLSGVIRKRKQLRLKIKALTSEGRTTSYILGSLPVVVFGALMAISPEYLEVLWTQTMGMICLGVAAGLVVGCMILVNRMVDIDI